MSSSLKIRANVFLFSGDSSHVRTFQVHIPSLKQIYSGKVRDCYAVGEDKLLLVASDRISAFDVILGDPIPGKGKVLTALTNFWFGSSRTSSPITSPASPRNPW